MAFTWSDIQQVFRDPDLHARFQAEGYVVLPFLDPAPLEAIHAIYRRIHPSDEAGFYTTTFNQDPEHRRAVHTAILEVARPSIEALFQDHKVYFCSFITKAPGPKSELILHQDMTLVDESRFNGINIWCPLVDLDATNGAIQVLPGSHRIYPTYRGSALPDIYDGVEREVKHCMKSLFLPAGTAVIFDQSIMHYSPPNLSDAVRPVINCFVTHQEASIVTAWADRNQHPGKVELFAQDEDFMFHFGQFGHDIFARPRQGRSLGWTDYDFPQVTREILEARYGPLPLPPANQSASPVILSASEGSQKTTPRPWWHRVFSRTPKRP